MSRSPGADSPAAGLAALAAALLALTLLVYFPILGFEFLNYDDPGYVTANPRVLDGLGPANAVWALGAFQNGNWHPVTVLSHMLDVSLFGTDPKGHHAMNLALHAANVLALFALLRRATSRLGRSAFVAAVFAVHPLNVQSVAWVAERKSLLSTLFWLLALLAWTGYRRRGGALRYGSALGCAAIALASKPMAVTLPFTLLLLDAWPLAISGQRRPTLSFERLREILPFLVLSAACSLATLAAQRSASAVQSLESYPLAVRLANVPVGYTWYLLKTVWPSGLAVFHPHPHQTASWTLALACAAALAVASVAAARIGGTRPYVATGWWWYAITLAPVAGIVQVGSQAYADRYAYVPLIGIFIVVGWSAADAGGRALRAVRPIVALGCIAALAVACRETLEPWRNSEALFRRAVEVVPDGAVAHNNLGMALVDQGRAAEALAHFQAAVRYAPWDIGARSNLGSALTVLGRPGEALPVFEGARRDAPGDPSVRFNLAKALAAIGRTDEAMAELIEAGRIDPAYPKAPLLLGLMLLDARRIDEAIPALERAAALAPRDAQAQFSLGIALAASGRKVEALGRIEEALRIDPKDRRAAEAAARLRLDLGRR